MNSMVGASCSPAARSIWAIPPTPRGSATCASSSPWPLQLTSASCRGSGVSFVPYSTPTGDVQLVEYGLKSPEAMVRTAERESAVLTWALRLAGFVLMFMGFKLVFAIIEAIAAFLPLAWLSGAVLSVAAGILAFVLSTIVIGTAWMAQRPLVATGFVVALIGASVAVWYRRRTKKHLPSPQ